MYLVLLCIVDFDVRTKDTALTPLLVAASYNRKNAVLWLLQDGRDRINVDATNSEGRNAVHLACLDLQCQYTIEVCQFECIYLSVNYYLASLGAFKSVPKV